MLKNKNIKLLMIFNVFLLFINFYFINEKQYSLNIQIKNVDNFYFYLNRKSFLEISFFLKKKFISHLHYKLLSIFTFLYSLILNNKKSLLLYVVDNQHHFNNLINILKKKYNIKLTKKNPDYLIYNVFGCKHLKKEYNKSIKIAIYTENQIPDFNVADYAISHAHINYLDRHFNSEFYFFNYFNHIKISALMIARKKVLLNPIRQKFCAAVISNYKHSNKYRLKFIKELNKYKTVDMGGKYKNNIGRIKNKIAFLSLYKFSIAMENTEADGYTSEKIIDSFLSGTIPIYYGNHLIDEYINPKSIILIRGEKDMNEKIEYIKKIDNDLDLYRSFIKEKILIDNSRIKKNKKEYAEFLYHIFEQKKKEAKRVENIKHFFN